MTSSLRVLTASSLDSSPSLLLVAPDGAKILLDCGEGCQRAFIEYSQKVSSVQAVCLTVLDSHEGVGGLPGFLLTASDIVALNNSNNNSSSKQAAAQEEILIDDDNERDRGRLSGDNRRRGHPTWPFCPVQPEEKADLHLFGPIGTRAYLEALRHFARRSKFKLRLYEQRQGVRSEDPLPVVPVAQNNTTKGSGGKKNKKKDNKSASQPVRFSVSCLPFEEQMAYPDDDKDNDSPPPPSRAGHKRPRPDEQPRKIARHSVSYLFTTPNIVGKFLPDQARQLGVPQGPMFAQLKAGQSVTFVPQGGEEPVTVHSHQVVTPSTPGIAVLVLRYPTQERSLDDFFQALQLSERLEPAGAQLDLVVHLATSEVFQHATAVQWRRAIDNHHTDVKVHHLWMKLGDEDADSPHLSATLTARIRAQICPEIYQTPWCPAGPEPTIPLTEKHTVEKDAPSTSMVIGKPGMEYRLLPRGKRGFGRVDTLDDPNDNEATRMQEMEESGARHLAQTVIEKEKNEEERKEDSPTEGTPATLLFTGTASAQPCKYRNVTGMLLSNHDGRSMLLDVGEGTVGQLLRMQTSAPNEARLLASITVAWISHPHADHHLGLLRLLENRRAKRPLLLIAPPPIFRFLQEYAAGVDPNIAQTYQGLDCREFIRSNPHAVKQLNEAIGFTNCQSVQVEHCPYSYAVFFDGTPFGRVVYSGDCRPSAKLAAAAKPADLLIHESTFEDSMKSEAFLKKHCTIGEALGIAQAMQAKRTVLTHFSQRYPRIPPPTEVVDTTDMCIVFAFDFQRLTTQTLDLAAQLTPALRMLYPEEQDGEGGDQQARERTEAAAQETLATPGLFANSDLI